MSKLPSGPDDLADPLNPKVGAAALDFLLIELVPQMQRTAAQVHARDLARRQQRPRASGGGGGGQYKASGGDGTGGSDVAATVAAATLGERAAGDEAGALLAGGAEDEVEGDEEVRAATRWRLDALGYRVGQGLVERFSVNKPRTQTALDAIKFVCKDLWQLVFRKQIDNLKTNHRGVFVLTDQRFHPLSRMSVDRRAGPRATEDAVRRAQMYLYFPAGVIRGALAGLGFEATVMAESTEIPTATFQIKTKGAVA